MTRLEKCELAKQIGYTYDPETGEIYGLRGKEIKGQNKDGYIMIHNTKISDIRAHHFAWYMVYGNVDFDMLDHIDQDKTNNRITNLRIATPQVNQHNRLKTTKGYFFSKKDKKYRVRIVLNYKTIHGGYFNTEKEARNRYLELKEIYHLK